eukprot:gene12343-14475_t
MSPREAIGMLTDEPIGVISTLLRLAKLSIIFLPALLTSPMLIFPRLDKLWWKLLLESMQIAGTCYIKFGQWISTRPDLFPKLLCDQFSRLHNKCPSHSFNFTQEKNFGQTIEELFLYFDKEPMASGSVAQVHKAVTKDGVVVVVKVLHPHVHHYIKTDFTIIYTALWAVSCAPGMKWLSLPESVIEFGKSMMKQVDLKLEADHLSTFIENFKTNKEVIFPRPCHPLVSRDVLVETYEPGEPIMDYIMTNSPYNPTLARIGLDAYMQMMLVDNFIHSDLHPGNVLVRDPNMALTMSQESGLQRQRKTAPASPTLYTLKVIDLHKPTNSLPKLVLLDVGLVTELGSTDKSHFKELFTEVVKGDGKAGAELIIKYAREAQCSEQEMFEFKEKMGAIFSHVQRSKVSDIHFGHLMGEVLGLVREYHVKLESNFATLVMGTIILEGLGKQLDPNLSLVKAAIPFLFHRQTSYILPEFFSEVIHTPSCVRCEISLRTTNPRAHSQQDIEILFYIFPSENAQDISDLQRDLLLFRPYNQKPPITSTVMMSPIRKEPPKRVFNQPSPESITSMLSFEMAREQNAYIREPAVPTTPPRTYLREQPSPPLSSSSASTAVEQTAYIREPAPPVPIQIIREILPTPPRIIREQPLPPVPDYREPTMPMREQPTPPRSFVAPVIAKREDPFPDPPSHLPGDRLPYNNNNSGNNNSGNNNNNNNNNMLSSSIGMPKPAGPPLPPRGRNIAISGESDQDIQDELVSPPVSPRLKPATPPPIIDRSRLTSSTSAVAIPGGPSGHHHTQSMSSAQFSSSLPTSSSLYDTPPPSFAPSPTGTMANGNGVSHSRENSLGGKKPRTSTKARIEKFFSKTSLTTRSTKTLPQGGSLDGLPQQPSSPTPERKATMAGGRKIKFGSSPDLLGEEEAANGGYSINTSNGAGDTNEVDEMDADGADCVSSEELAKMVSQVEFLQRDRRMLKETVNFTYPEKYRSFLAYDELLRMERGQSIVTPAFQASSPRTQYELCRREERRMLAEIFTLKNVLNVVEENKALAIRVDEMQKMIDTMIVEKKSLMARFDEMLVAKSKSDARRVEEEGIIFTDSDNGREQIIKGGTTDRLIERLYNKNIIGSVSDYVDTFLLTYRSFTTSKYVLEYLTRTYNHNTATEEVGDSERQFQVEQENLGKKKIRLRICNFLRRWVDIFFHDFDSELIQEYEIFIANCKDEKLNGLLRRTLDKKLTGSSFTKTTTFGRNPPPPVMPKTPILSIDDIDPQEMARQLTIIEFDMFKAIASKELLSLSWQKSDKEKRSPNLLKMIYRFNEISNWIVCTLVRETNLKKRGQHLKRFIKLTEELRKLNNFNCVFVVVSALHSASVNRIQKTWGEISKQQQKQFEEFVALTSPNFSFSAYREELHNANPPCIPYLGVHLSDLTFIEEGNKDTLENGLINFYKNRMVAGVIKEIQQYQQQPYNLLPVPEISNLLMNHKIVSEAGRQGSSDGNLH